MSHLEMLQSSKPEANPLIRYSGDGSYIESVNMPEVNPLFIYADTFSNTGDKMLSHGFSVIRDFFDLPTIVDKFSKHSERQAWREHIELADPDAFEIYEKNTLRTNHIASAAAGIESMLMRSTDLLSSVDVERVFDALKYVMRRYKILWDKSKTDMTEEKVEFINNLFKPFLIDVVILIHTAIIHGDVQSQLKHISSLTHTENKIADAA